MIKLVFYNDNLYLKTISTNYLCVQRTNFAETVIMYKYECSRILTVVLLKVVQV